MQIMFKQPAVEYKQLLREFKRLQRLLRPLKENTAPTKEQVPALLTQVGSVIANSKLALDKVFSPDFVQGFLGIYKSKLKGSNFDRPELEELIRSLLALRKNIDLLDKPEVVSTVSKMKQLKVQATAKEDYLNDKGDYLYEADVTATMDSVLKFFAPPSKGGQVLQQIIQTYKNIYQSLVTVLKRAKVAEVTEVIDNPNVQKATGGKTNSKQIQGASTIGQTLEQVVATLGNILAAVGA